MNQNHLCKREASVKAQDLTNARWTHVTFTHICTVILSSPGFHPEVRDTTARRRARWAFGQRFYGIFFFFFELRRGV